MLGVIQQLTGDQRERTITLERELANVRGDPPYLRLSSLTEITFQPDERPNRGC